MKKIILLLTALLVAIHSFGCAPSSDSVTSSSDNTQIATLDTLKLTQEDYYHIPENITDISLDDGIPAAITSSGAYRYSGTSDNNTITVNGEGMPPKGDMPSMNFGRQNADNDSSTPKAITCDGSISAVNRPEGVSFIIKFK